MSNTILQEIRNNGNLPGGLSAEQALSGVLCILMSRLSGGQARSLFEGLDVFNSHLQTCLLHKGEAPETFTLQDIIRRIGILFKVPVDDADRLLRTVVGAVVRHLTDEEVRKVASQLPGDLKILWETQNTA